MTAQAPFDPPSTGRLQAPPPPSAVDGGGAATAASPPRRKKRKGLKPRHIPQRTCIVTRQAGDKRGLVRIVRTPEGRVEVDPTGKKNGRGAYLTADRAIWERALAGNFLARALKVDIDPEDRAALHAYAATLPVEPKEGVPRTEN